MENLPMPHRLHRVMALVASTTLLLAIAIPATAADAARVRVLHASPDAPNVDIYLDDAKVDALTNVPFKTISGYLSVPTGAHNVKVVPTGGAVTDAVIDADVTFASGTSYTVAATNVVASIEAQVVTDAPTPNADGAQVRVVHFSADTPAVDVRPDGGTPIVTNLAYPDATDYLDIPGATYDLEVCATGTDTCPLDLDPVAIDDGTSSTVFAVGSLTGETLTAVVALDATAAPVAPATDTLEPAATASVGTAIVGLAAFVALVALSFVVALRWVDRRSAS
jgi:Domain of unknown function (DUF4397)